MKVYFLLLLAVAAPLSVLAQTEAAVDAQSARIGAERNLVQQQFAAQEVACYRKFAVNDCLRANRAHRRDRLADLRRQELALNDAERKRRASEHVRSIEQRDAARDHAEEAAGRTESLERYRQRAADSQEKAAQRAAKQASEPKLAASSPVRSSGALRQPPTPAARREAKPAAPRDTQEAQRSYAERQREAQERRERVQKRLAEPGRGQPLPVPP